MRSLNLTWNRWTWWTPFWGVWNMILLRLLDSHFLVPYWIQRVYMTSVQLVASAKSKSQCKWCAPRCSWGRGHRILLLFRLQNLHDFSRGFLKISGHPLNHGICSMGFSINQPQIGDPPWLWKPPWPRNTARLPRSLCSLSHRELMESPITHWCIMMFLH